jgi:hypothetical protein
MLDTILLLTLNSFLSLDSLFAELSAKNRQLLQRINIYVYSLLVLGQVGKETACCWEKPHLAAKERSAMTPKIVWRRTRNMGEE